MLVSQLSRRVCVGGAAGSAGNTVLSVVRRSFSVSASNLFPLLNPEPSTESHHFRRSGNLQTQQERNEPRQHEDLKEMWKNPIPHAVWSREETRSVEVTHKEPEQMVDRVAHLGAKILRFAFDTVTSYKHEGRLSVDVWLRRLIFLETVAAVPGMTAGMLRHMRSLRRLARDHGWIHSLLEEAENERMHLMVFLQLRDPGPMFRLCVLLGQGVFFNIFFLSYLVSPRLCHRFVGYIEEEATMTYTRLIHDIENGLMPEWENEQIPKFACLYWGLQEDDKFVELIYAIRADESNHRDVNHTFASLPTDATNPFIIPIADVKQKLKEVPAERS